MHLLTNQIQKADAVTIKRELFRCVCVILSLTAAIFSGFADAAEKNSIYSYQLSLKSEIPVLLPNQLISVAIKVQNTSGRVWAHTPANPINLSYHWLKENGEMVVHDGLRTEIPNRFTAGVLKAKIRAPSEVGDYICEFDLVHEMVSWFAQRGQVPLRVPVGVGVPSLQEIKESVNREKKSTIWWCDLEDFNVLQFFIKSTLQENTTAFFGFSGPIYAFNAGEGYPQFWVRDLATIVPVAQYYFDAPYLSSWIDEFFFFQNGDGSIYDWIDSHGLCEKNTVESDQESSLILAAYTYFAATNDVEWLQKHTASLDSALTFLLQNRMEPHTQLIWSGYTADWGDNSPVYGDHSTAFLDPHTPMVVNLYTNALFVRACSRLSQMYLAIGNKARSLFWKKIDENWRRRIKEVFRFSKYYRMHAQRILSEDKRLAISHSIFPLGSNAAAILSEIPDNTQVRQIYHEAKARQEKYGISTISGVLLPPFPENFFNYPDLKKPFSYQNGGQWDWIGGRFILGLYETGLVTEATKELAAIARKVIKNGGFFEWDTPDGEGRGNAQYAGGAAAVGQAIIEGLFGISTKPKGWDVTIRLGNNQGEIRAYRPVTNSSIHYHYKPQKDKIYIRIERSNRNEDVLLKIWKPGGPWKSLVVNGREINYARKEVNGTFYYILKEPGLELNSSKPATVGSVSVGE